MKIRLILLFALLTGLTPFSYATELETGIYHLNRGEFKSAITSFEPLLAEGYGPAQYQMGLMYKNGYGVKKSYREAFSLFSLAAEQHNPDAQFELSPRL